MTTGNRASVDAFLADVIREANAGLDEGAAGRAIAEGVEAIGKLFVALNARSAEELAKEPTGVLTRSISQAVKGLDELFRLMQFAKGQPDSRPDVGKDWLGLLTNEELASLQARAVSGKA